MIFVKVGQIAKEDFTVVDSAGTLVTGLVDGNFTKKLYDPNGNEDSGSITVIVSELGNGNYRASYTPDEIGIWYLSIYHTTYFPWGKNGTIQVFNSDFDSLDESLDYIIDVLDSTSDSVMSSLDDINNSMDTVNNSLSDMTVILTRLLGLSQENHYLDNTSYDDDDNLISCRIRIYSNASDVGSINNVIDTYLVTAGYTGELLSYYKVVKQSGLG